jgi:hypothetical protein
MHQLFQNMHSPGIPTTLVHLVFLTLEGEGMNEGYISSDVRQNLLYSSKCIMI